MNEEICCRCKHLFFTKSWPFSVPQCDITDSYVKDILANKEMYGCNGVILSCKDFDEFPSFYTEEMINRWRYGLLPYGVEQKNPSRLKKSVASSSN